MFIDLLVETAIAASSYKHIVSNEAERNTFSISRHTLKDFFLNCVKIQKSRCFDMNAKALMKSEKLKLYLLMPICDKMKAMLNACSFKAS